MSTSLGEGVPRTVVVPGGTGSSLTATLAANGRFVVESVVATIDATAAGAVTPELSITDQFGVVIGTKPQTQSIPGGGSGLATWALRLSDDQAASAPQTGVQLDYVERTTSLTAGPATTNWILGNNVTYSGTQRVRIDCYSDNMASNNTAFTDFRVNLYLNGVIVGEMARLVTQGDGIGNYAPLFASRFLTPPAGVHAYQLKTSGAGGVGAGGTLLAGTGVGGAIMPAFLRITTA